MSPALLSKQQDAAAPKRSLRVAPPGDSFEREADRVAATVVAGGRLPGWSLSKMGMGAIRRQATPQSNPQPNNYNEAGTKLFEAFLRTDVGKQLTQALKNDPLAKAAEDFVSTLSGKIITGAAAAGVVSALAATHTALSVPIPEIPLDTLKAGLKVKITYEGPVNHPTKAMLMFSYAPGGNKKKPKDASERFRAETAQIAAEQNKFRAGMHYKAGSPRDLAEKADRENERRAIEQWSLHRIGPFPQLGASNTSALAGGAPAGGQTARGLHMPELHTPFEVKRPTLFDKKLELKPFDQSKGDDTKREELQIQRKARSLEPATADRGLVDPVVNSTGRPLDDATRRLMESRMGCDFGNVRLHTDSEAAESAEALGALAFTHGSHIVFGAGRYSPHTTEGQRLIAHELTHVVQQNAAPVRPCAPPMMVRPAPTGIIQRDEDEGAEPSGNTSWFSNPLDKLKAVIRKIPGYKLFSVIIGKDPISNDVVPRDATNLTRGVLNLVPGGDRAFANLQESGGLDRAFDWLRGQIDELGFTVDYFKGLIEEALKSLSLSDIADPQGALARIAGIFQPPFDKLKQFAARVFNKILEFMYEAVLESLGGLGILEILRKAGQAFGAILKDPIGFLKNLLAALAQGFNQFKDKILDYLEKGVAQWLFGAIASTGLTLPKKFDLAGIVNLLLQVLGLTWAKFRKRLVAILGEDAVGYLEGAFDFLVTLSKQKSLAGAWKLILEKADNLIDTVMGAIKDWVVTQIVVAAVTKLATMFNPVGALVQAIRVIYDTINFFIEKAQQIKALAEAVFDSISEIARGNITQAANKVETTMGMTIPVVLGFLADLIGLGGVGEKVKTIIQRIQARVEKAIDKVLDYIVGKGRDLYAKGKETVAKIVEWWKQRKELKFGGESHTLYMEGTEDAPKVMIASVPGKPWSQYLKNKSVPDAKKPLLEQTRALAKKLENRLGPTKNDDQKAKAVEERRAWFDQLAQNLEALEFTEEANAPASKIEYASNLTGDGGGRQAAASILSKKHPPGTVPSDEAPIWTNLGSLIQKKHYVQGHLLNHNLGGEGRRFNLSPINKKANADHLSAVERYVKRWVNGENKVVSYEVRAVYGKHTEDPKRYKDLRSQKAKESLTPKQNTELRELEAEQKLCTAFAYEAQQLAFVNGKWGPAKQSKIDGEKAQIKGEVKNEIEV